jgi:hypothetical protein
MGEVSPASEPSLLATVDFRAFVETVRLRWWVVPLTVALAIGFLQAQESDLRTEPASFVVSRSYEVGSPYKSLNAIGINLIVSEFPDPQTQLLVLKSSEVRAEIDEKLGKEVEVQVPENWETPFTFTCNQPVKEDCVRAIDSYVEKVVELREDAIVTGIENLRAVLLAAQEKSPDPLVARQLVALDALSGNVRLPIALIDSLEQSIGPTVENVRRPTALVGAATGLLIGLLILLQLTFTDGRATFSRWSFIQTKRGRRPPCSAGPASTNEPGRTRASSLSTAAQTALQHCTDGETGGNGGCAARGGQAIQRIERDRTRRPDT